jgi:hypothetical protein
MGDAHPLEVGQPWCVWELDQIHLVQQRQQREQTHIKSSDLLGKYNRPWVREENPNIKRAAALAAR